MDDRAEATEKREGTERGREGEAEGTSAEQGSKHRLYNGACATTARAAPSKMVCTWISIGTFHASVVRT